MARYCHKVPHLLPLSGCIIGSLCTQGFIPSSKLGPLFAGLCLILYTPLRASPGYCGDSGATVARKRSLTNSYADTLLKDASHRLCARLQPRIRSATSKFQELG
jgi:hypothetical protein